LLAAWPDPAIAATLEAVRRWTERTFASIRSRLEARRREGFVRECHGDLHLGNIAVVDGRVAIFDCIDFNPRMRWNDLMGEVAFLAMDLEYRGRADLADRFVNRYMEATGDYAGAAVLRFFVVYRAMVRARSRHCGSRRCPPVPSARGSLPSAASTSRSRAPGRSRRIPRWS